MNEPKATIDLPFPSGNPLAFAYGKITRLQGHRAMIAAFIAGVLSNLAFAPAYIWPANLLAISCLVWLIDGAVRTDRPRRAVFWRGGAFALGFFGVGFHWIAFAFLVNPGKDLAYIWLAFLLPVGLAAIWGASLRLMVNIWPRGPSRVVLLAATLFAAEWVRGHLFGGFPWNLPGMVWAPGGAVSQIASLVGVWGLSALTLLAFAAPAALVDMRQEGRANGGALAKAAPAVAAALTFGAVWGWGSQRLAMADTAMNGPAVRLVDVGAPQSEKFDPNKRMRVLRRYLELTGAPRPGDPSIVVWPEGALPYALLQYPDALEPVAGGLGDRELIVGTSFVDKLEYPERWYNALAVISRDAPFAGPLDIYYKHRLVPFGEMVPLRGVAAAIGLSALQELATSGFYAGPAPAPMSVPGIPDFEPLICYEALFSGLLPPRRDNSGLSDAEQALEVRPEWIVNISIDAWFGPLWAPAQHMEHARYRSIEEGLPMVRVASRGVSGVIDPYGRLRARAAAPQPDKYGPDPDGWKGRILDSATPEALEPTPFSRWRGLLLWPVILLFAAGWILLPRN